MFSFRRIVYGIKSLIFGPADKRLRVLNELARVFAALVASNYVGDSYKLWILESSFVNKFRTLSPHNYFSEERKYALKEFAKSLTNVDGDIAECGSYVGVSAWFIAHELPEVDFYLFDSFEGLSAPSDFDSVPAGIQQWREGDLLATEDVLIKNLQEYEHIHIMKGWIPDRFIDVENLRFRLVHIDVDLYQPTHDSLEFFYERVNPGGMIVMDDYGYQNCPGAYKAANDFMADKPESIIHLPTGQGLIIKHCGS